MTRIGIGGFGSPFSHDVSSCMGYYPQKFLWTFNQVPESGICVFMDHDILGGQRVVAPHKFLWLCESREIVPKAHQFVSENFEYLGNIYKKIFTHDYSLLDKSNIFEFAPPASNYPWIKDTGTVQKTTLVSMISSGKAVTKGHVIRNRMMSEIRRDYPHVEVFGRNFRPFAKKEEVLKNVFFSIVVENSAYECYYTEKLMDCFAARVVPIYWGAKSVSRWFDVDGIIQLDSSSDVNVVKNLTIEEYFRRSSAIESNFHSSMEHVRADDWIFESISRIV
jgi:hypothetical protein